MDGSTCEIIELRQYTLVPGSTSAFVELFEEHLVAPQEALGMQLLGIFTRPDEDDKFVWLRGFAARSERKRALEAFYYGPVWKQHREQANGMMIDSDDVHLLRPAPGCPTIEDLIAESPGDPASTSFALTVAPRPVVADQSDRAARTAVLETEPTANDFPQLPVHPHAVQVTLRRMTNAESAAAEVVRLIPTARSRLR